MRKVLNKIFLNPLLVMALTALIIGIGTYIRGAALYPFESVAGRTTFYGPMALVIVSVGFLLRARQWRNATLTALLCLLMLPFAYAAVVFTAEQHVIRATWHTASAELPDGLGRVEVRTRSLYADSWCPLPPGYDVVWEVHVRQPGRPDFTFQLPGCGCRKTIVGVTNPGGRHRMLLLTDTYSDIVTVVDMDTRQLVDATPEEPGRGVGAFEWSYPEVRFKPSRKPNQPTPSRQ